MPKYIFVDGVMKIDPAYQAQQSAQGKPSTTTPDAIAVVSSTQDMQEATQVQQRATGKPMQISESTIASIEIMQDPDYLKKFDTKQNLDGGTLLDGLSNVFAKYEVPIGLVNKLLALTEYDLNFIIDDSGSMNDLSDVLMQQASPQVRQARDPYNKRSNDRLTRWEEAEDRLHILLDMLAYLPIDKIKLSFFNNSNYNNELNHKGKTPEQFAEESHRLITRLFNLRPNGRTPLYKNLAEAFRAKGNTMHYVFTDGEPSDASIQEVKELIKQRPNPKMNPLTFISCTNNDDECDWMKQIEEEAPFTSELDDFISERREVLKDQGSAFPFTKGFWLISMLAASINPYDLDAMDESVPFTKKTLNDLMGRNITLEEYRHYFRLNPNAAKYGQIQNQFEREDILAKDILLAIQQGKLPQPTHSIGVNTPTPSAGYPAGIGAPAQATGYLATAPAPSGYPNSPAPSYYENNRFFSSGVTAYKQPAEQKFAPAPF